MRILRGIGIPPAAVGLARGIVWLVIVAAIEVVVQLATHGAIPSALLPWAPVIVLVGRTSEGMIDQADVKKVSALATAVATTIEQQQRK